MARSLADGPAMHRLDPVGLALLFKVNVGSCESEAANWPNIRSQVPICPKISRRSVCFLFIVPFVPCSRFRCCFPRSHACFVSCLVFVAFVACPCCSVQYSFSPAGSRRWGNATKLVGFFRRVGPRAESIFNK